MYKVKENFLRTFAPQITVNIIKYAEKLSNCRVSSESEDD